MALSAAELGKKLLDEVEEVGLSEEYAHCLKLLESFRQSANVNHPPPLNVPALDRILNASGNAIADHQHHPALELTSAAPGSGTTQLLYYLIAAAILPPSLSGLGAAAVILDADGRFDVSRLAQIMHYYISMHSSPPPPLDTSLTIRHALQHLHVFRPSSLASLTATIRALPDYLLSPKPSHTSGTRALSLLCLDGATAFFWQDRMAVSQSATPSTPEQPTSGYPALIAALRDVQTEFGCAIVATSWGLTNPTTATKARTRRGKRPVVRSPVPWAPLRVLRLGVAREGVSGFPVEMGVEGAERDREARQGVVERGRFGVWVEGGDGEEGARVVRGMGFGFRIFEEGVVVDGEDQAEGKQEG